MEEMIMTFVAENKIVIGLAGFMFVEKLVKLSPFKWDDLLIDSIKAAITATKSSKTIK
jgi:hypothetical protein